MKFPGPFRWLSVLLLMAVAGPVQAQFLALGRKASTGEAPPKALFIELLTRGNQRNFLKKYRPALMPEFDQDVQAVLERTVLDWKRYFHFCPLYFFMDTCAEKIQNGMFAGVLLDSNLNPVARPVVPDQEKNIYIGYYGSATPQTSGADSAYFEAPGDDASPLIRERFVVMNADFKMLAADKPRTNYFRKIRPDFMDRRQYRAYRSATTYNARRWYIDYQPTAYSYDATLRRYFRQ